MTYKKKLIEVALPLEAINREAAREKSIRFGHPSTLHLWWARRPLAACRAVLFASLVDDPSAHPDQFPTEEAQQAERERLFRILEELVKWENTTNERVLEAARGEILRSCDGMPPPVLDPFCGGGSIPLEAQRLGLEVHASDLNPVAVLITKALIELPPMCAHRPPVHPADGSFKKLGGWKGAEGLAEDLRYYGNWMRDEVERRIGHLYPKVTLSLEHGGGEATVIAWIWARTVKSPNPAWDGPTPLVRSFMLSTKKGKEIWVQPIIDRENKQIRFDVRTGPGCPEGTVSRTGATCLATGTPVPLSYIREEGKAGRMGAQLMAIVAQGAKGRVYLAPNEQHETVASKAEPEWRPSQEVPSPSHDVDRLPMYGMTHWGDAFTARQATLLTTLIASLPEVLKHKELETDPEYAKTLSVYLALAVSRLTDSNNTICTWSSSRDQTRNMFARQAIQMSWDFVENNPFAGAAGDLGISVRSVAQVVERLPALTTSSVRQLDVAGMASTSGVGGFVCTDPPYYDNVGYSDLSDFFYAWLRPMLKSGFSDLFSTLVTPKAQELISAPHRHGGRKQAEKFFEERIARAFVVIANEAGPDAPTTIFYAFKQMESDVLAGAVSTGWETMLSGLLSAGLTINGTWPVRSERPGRTREISSNALASSIVLVCRHRPIEAALGTRKEFLAALKSKLPLALRHLQQGNIAPVDLAQAAIGPGIGVFSRYSKVVEADGRPMTVRTALGLINQVLDETLAEQESDFDADTRWALAWFEQFGMNAGPFGAAETLSKAKNTAVNALVVAGFLESKGGKVRLLDRGELASTWDPATDTRLTVWEVTQHLIGALESLGEAAAGELLRRVGGMGDTARELAYRLYIVCERKKWSKEALAYNGLVVAWPEIARLAAGEPVSGLIQETLL